MVNLHKKPRARYELPVKSDKEIREAASKNIKKTSLGHKQGIIPYGITPEKEYVLIELIKRGLPFGTACAKAGVSYFTFCDWMIRGGDPKSNDKHKPAQGDEQEPYASFVLRIREAEADAEDQAIAALVDAYPKDWRAAQFFLSKRNPTEWGDRGASVSVEAGGSVTILLPDNGRDRESN